ncbi:MAG: hypothetical protein HY673_11015 [Chloroflexi bacterium]|nr:hypothetical protein [Chloroflexota bacterium]
MSLERIQAMLQSCTAFPPTDLYNETWLLRLILDWFSRNKVDAYPLSFAADARWFAEAELRSAFLHPPTSGAGLAEGWSHSDGAIGHFEIGKFHKFDLSLREDAVQLVVLEGKMFAPLTRGVRHAPYFDQAARTVGCIAETLAHSKRQPAQMSHLGFYILAPRKRVEEGDLTGHMKPSSIRDKVQRRVKEYVEAGDPSKQIWYVDWFEPTLDRLKLGVLTWEEVIGKMEQLDALGAGSIRDFYKKCLFHNRQAIRGDETPVTH